MIARSSLSLRHPQKVCVAKMSGEATLLDMENGHSELPFPYLSAACEAIEVLLGSGHTSSLAPPLKEGGGVG